MGASYGHPLWQVLVRVECVRCPWALLQNKVSTIFGIIFLSVPHTFLPEGVVLGLWNSVRMFYVTKFGFFRRSNIFGSQKNLGVKIGPNEMRSPLWHGRKKMFASVDGGPSRGSSKRRPVSKDPHWQSKLMKLYTEDTWAGYRVGSFRVILLHI
jgi:hypothetical protein